MKQWTDAARDAIEAGIARIGAAVEIATDDPVRVWSGEGLLPLYTLADVVALASAHPAFKGLFNAADRTTMLQPDGSTAVTADSHKVGTLSDLLDDYDFTSPSEADSPTAADGLTFSGTTELRAAPATPPTSAAVFMVVVTTDAQAGLLNDSTDGRYSGVIESGSGSPAHSEGAADNYVDGSATSITTRGALYTALADGEPHIVEMRGIPLTTWANLEIGGFAGGGGLYRLNGVAIPVCVLDDDDEDIATARALALRLAKHLIYALGLSETKPDDSFIGLSHREIGIASSGTLGGLAQNITLSLSGIDPAVLELLDATDLRGAPVTIWTLIGDSTGRQILDSYVHRRGRVDRVPVEETAGGTATIEVEVETAANGLGRKTGRLRSDADQRLIKSDDGSMRAVTYASEKVLYWGGERPARAGSSHGGSDARGYGGRGTLQP